MTDKMYHVLVTYMYGDKVSMNIKDKHINNILIGDLSFENTSNEKLDRSIILIPETPYAILYNKYKEDVAIKKANENKVNNKKNYISIKIPEKNILIYSRVIICRIDEEGNLSSIKDGDYEKLEKYMAIKE